MAKRKTVVTAISKISEHPINRAAALVVIHGQDLGRKYDLVERAIVIGRAAKADIQIDQESISRNHAKLAVDEKAIVLKDLGSTNGTYVNDEKVEGEFMLRNGDFVKIGRTIFKFIAGGNIESAYHEEIYKLTTVDGLTQVFNRRYFDEQLEREISRASRYKRELSLIIMDVDHFKKINDKYGHLAGDSVLKMLATLIRGKIRREDIFARYGGEEFGLLLPEIDHRGAVSMAEKIRKLVMGSQFAFEDEEIGVTLSLGVATLGSKHHDSAALVRTADAKLYAAKHGGRNKVCG